MRKFFISFYSAPVTVLLVLLLSYILAFSLFSGQLTNFTEEGGPVDIITYCCYFALFAALFFYRHDFQTKEEKRAHKIFCFWAVTAFLREAGIQHWLTTTDSTAFKIRFFTNPNNPLCEKILAFALLALVGVMFIYSMYLYLIPAFKGFFRKMTGSWSVITFLSAGALSKIVDRLPGNLRKHGLDLDRSGIIFGVCQICEETLETCLPILAIVMLIQFHENKTMFFPHTGKQADINN